MLVSFPDQRDKGRKELNFISHLISAPNQFATVQRLHWKFSLEPLWYKCQWYRITTVLQIDNGVPIRKRDEEACGPAMSAKLSKL